MSAAAAAAAADAPASSSARRHQRSTALTTSIRIAGNWFDAVRDVSFEVSRRETLALVGESGCGKSLTALSVMGLLPAGVGRISSGRIMVDGVDMTAASDGRQAGDARRPHRHDLPGADDLAEPGAAGRLPDRRGADRASRHEPARARRSARSS